jgi:hypothetical protein
MTVVYIHVVRDGPFNFQEGVMVFFLKKYSDSQYVAEKNILIMVEEKNLIQSFCHKNKNKYSKVKWSVPYYMYIYYCHMSL